MLFLSRRKGEEIKIGRDITIVIGRVAGQRVVIGVEAPERVRVLRGELEPYVREFEDDAHDDAEPARQLVVHSR
jgi:carbon storage regulator